MASSSGENKRGERKDEKIAQIPSEKSSPEEMLNSLIEGCLTSNNKLITNNYQKLKAQIKNYDLEAKEKLLKPYIKTKAEIPREQAIQGVLYDLMDDFEKAHTLFKSSAEKGDTFAQCNLGDMYFCGIGVVQDDVAALDWFRKAAEQGHAGAQYNLGYMYLHGRGVVADNVAALDWFRKAAEQGHAGAQATLGNMYFRGQAVLQDDVASLDWDRKAAEQGHASAQYHLGYMYLNGRGVVEDYVAALDWFRKAAEQGNASAQYHLGYMYLNGRGVVEDYVAALDWFRKAAEQGLAAAQAKLGTMYFRGQAVLQDDVASLDWDRKAAEQGHASAQYHLGYMYLNGRGVVQDDVAALEWFRKAALQGHRGAQIEIMKNWQDLPNDPGKIFYAALACLPGVEALLNPRQRRNLINAINTLLNNDRGPGNTLLDQDPSYFEKLQPFLTGDVVNKRRNYLEAVTAKVMDTELPFVLAKEIAEYLTPDAKLIESKGVNREIVKNHLENIKKYIDNHARNNGLQAERKSFPTNATICLDDGTRKRVDPFVAQIWRELKEGEKSKNHVECLAKIKKIAKTGANYAERKDTRNFLILASLPDEDPQVKEAFHGAAPKSPGQRK